MEFLTAVKETLVGDDAGADEEATNDGERPNLAVESGREVRSPTPRKSELDFVAATGRTRKETLLELVEAHEGRVKQAELVALTEWSKSTVSRNLGAPENDGTIDRVQIGRCKVVLLPDEYETFVGEHPP